MATEHFDPAEYCVRQGGDGKWGIYPRNYNVRLATFSDDSFHFREGMKELFDTAVILRQRRAEIGKPAKRVKAK